MKRKLQVVEGETYVTISRVCCGWDVEASGKVAHVPIFALPTLQSKGLDEFVDGRSVAGMILDTSRTNGQTRANPLN